MALWEQSTQFNSGFMENSYSQNLTDFSCGMLICGGLSSCGPSALFGDQKKPHSEERTYHLAIPLIIGQQRTFQKVLIFFNFLPFMGQKVMFWVKRRCFWGVLD